MLAPPATTATTPAAEALALAVKAAEPDVLPEDLTSQTIVDNAHRIYDWMSENGIAVDSWTRECLFDYAAKDTGRDYDELYNLWLEPHLK